MPVLVVGSCPAKDGKEILHDQYINLSKATWALHIPCSHILLFDYGFFIPIIWKNKQNKSFQNITLTKQSFLDMHEKFIIFLKDWMTK